MWNEECDIVFKRHLKVVHKLYEKYSGKLALPGATKYMCAEEFEDMVVSSGVTDDNFG